MLKLEVGAIVAVTENDSSDGWWLGFLPKFPNELGVCFYIVCVVCVVLFVCCVLFVYFVVCVLCSLCCSCCLCSLFVVVRCSLFVVHRSLFVFVVHCSLFVVHCLLFVFRSRYTNLLL
jgi:hypothetical protein